MLEYTEFQKAYLEAIDFTELGEVDQGQPPKGAMLSRHSLARALNDCSNFERAFPEVVNKTQAGHDFWFTRQGHGTGFWDRDDEVYGVEMREMLTRAAKACGEVHDIDYGDTFVGRLRKNEKFITKDGTVLTKWIGSPNNKCVCKDKNGNKVYRLFEEIVWSLR